MVTIARNVRYKVSQMMEDTEVVPMNVKNDSKIYTIISAHNFHDLFRNDV